MKPNPILILVAILAGGWLFVQMVGACIGIVGIGLGSSPGFAVVAGFFIPWHSPKVDQLFLGKLRRPLSGFFFPSSPCCARLWGRFWACVRRSCA